jgi:hypothetical protein
MLLHVLDAQKPVPPFISGYLSRERIGRPRLRRAVARIYSGSESVSRATPGRLGSFVLRHSFVFRHSCFVIPPRFQIETRLSKPGRLNDF